MDWMLQEYMAWMKHQLWVKLWLRADPGRKHP